MAKIIIKATDKLQFCTRECFELCEATLPMTTVWLTVTDRTVSRHGVAGKTL